MASDDGPPATDDSPAAPGSEPPVSDPSTDPREARRLERESRRGERPQGMVPGRERRRTKVERATMRTVATGGIVGIGVALGALLTSQDVAGWIVGMVVSLVSIVLAAILWSSRQL